MKKTPDFSLSLAQRLAAPMPKFFKVLFYIGLVLAATGAAMFEFQNDLAEAGLVVPEWLTIVTTWVGAVSALISKLTIRIDE